MEDSLVIITSSITILALVFLFLYFKKFQEYLDIKARYEELQKAIQNSKQNQRARDDFLAMVVHELRSPLAVIRGSADLLLTDAQKLTQDQVVGIFSEIRSSSSDLLKLVNDLLDVSKIDSGRFEIFAKESDLNALLQDESHRYLSLAQGRGIKLEMSLDPKIRHFNFDPERIRQVMNNLLSNALKFTPQGGKVLIISEMLGHDIKVSIIDTGVGVPDEIKSRLFNKFVQGRSNAVTKERGTGLGLVIAKGIVEAHGGKIWLEDNKPNGAKFIFTLPIA